jgi:WD40 repeat protein
MAGASSLGSNGIRVFDATNGYRLLPSDTDYKDDSYSAMFDPAGRLVTTSYDGFVRLYAADKYAAPIAKFESKGHQPSSAAFSADGTRIAVGHSDGNDVVVLSGSNLTQLFRANTTGVPNVGLNAVAWSQDGRFLFAGGVRWGNGGRGTSIDVAATSQTIMEILGLKNGSMLMAHSKGFGLINPDAKVTQLQRVSGLVLNSGGGRTLRISADGTAVQVDSWEPNHTYRFALARRVIDIDPPADGALKAPITKAAGIAVTNWEESKRPAVNRKPIKLEAGDIAHSIAIVPGTQHLVLGTAFSLRLVNRQGQDVWPTAQPVPGEAWHVNVTGDGRLVVAAYGDGTIRWHRLSDAKELLALFIHPDGQRWIAWTPQGYYDASVGADELIGWHVNHGRDRAPDFYPASQFRSRFYRPDVIQRVLQTPNLDIEEAVRDADKEAGLPSTKAVSVKSLLTPVVTINDPKNPAALYQPDLTLGYTVQLPSSDDLLRVEARVDGVAVTAEDRSLAAFGDTRVGNLHLTIPRRNSTVSVLAYNKNGAGVPATVQVQWRGPGTDPKLTLYVLAIGINYKDDINHKNDSVPPLRFAAKDAADFVAAAKAQEGGLYEKVITHPPHGSLSGSEATKDAILDELDWIARAVTNTNDVAMIFLSGHGIKTPDQHYRFLPYDYDANRIPRTTISDSELEDYLTKIGGKKIFFFDTCYSGPF